MKPLEARSLFQTALLTLLAVLLASACDSVEDEAIPLRNKIVFSTRFGDSEPQIYVMNPNGTGRKRLSKSRMARSPSVSPDRSKIVYVSSASTTAGSPLYVMNADGTRPRSLGELIDFDNALFGKTVFGDSPEWSPTGDKIVFNYCVSCELGSDNEEIFIVDLTTNEFKRLSDNGWSDRSPVWSPDGRRLAFLSNRDFIGTENRGGYEIYLMDAEGTGQERLTFTEGKVFTKPAWSSHGNRIVFVEDGRTIVIMDLQGNRLQEIDPSLEADITTGPLAWSPDETKLLFGVIDNVINSEVPRVDQLFVLDLETQDTEEILQSDDWIAVDWIGE